MSRSSLTAPDPKGDGLQVALWPENPDQPKLEPAHVSISRSEVERALADWPECRANREALSALGERLGSCLLPEGTPRSWFLSALSRIEPEERIRLRLVIGDPGLACWPWELACLPRWGRQTDDSGFLALDPRISLVRLIPNAQDTQCVQQYGADWLSVLAATASPADRPPVNQALQQKAILLAFSQGRQQMPDAASMKPTFLKDASAEKIRQALRKETQVFQFAGHGALAEPDAAFRTTDVAAYMVLANDRNPARAVFWSASEMARAFTGCGVRLIVLGAPGLAPADGKAWASLAPSLVSLGLPAVLALQHDLEDESAIAFFASLYGALAAGLTLDEAVAHGRQQLMQMRGVPDADWAAPALWTRPGSGAIFPELTARRAEMDAKTRISIKQSVGTITGGQLSGHDHREDRRLCGHGRGH